MTTIFEVRNTGTTTILNISFTCGASGQVTCVSVSPTAQASLTPGQMREVVVTYAAGSAGTGAVVLTAAGNTGSPASDTLEVNVVANPVITLAAPLVGAKNRAVVRTRRPLVSVRWSAGGPAPGEAVDSTTAQLTWRGVDVTQTARVNRGLLEWAPDSAQGLGVIGSGAADSAALTLRICSQMGGCTTLSTRVVLPNDQAPILGFSAVPVEALGRAFGAPFGPGLSVTAGEVEAGVSTVPYVSMNAARSTGLVYSTRQSYPRVLVPVDVELTWPAGTPDALTFLLKDGATRLDSVRYASPSCATGAVRQCRVVLQGDFSASSFPTPTRKWLRVEARVTSGASTTSSADSVEVVLVDRRASRYGVGWWPTAGVELVQAGADRILVSATGAASIFRGNGDSLFLAPPGSEVVLERAGAQFELFPRGSRARSVYDTATGRLRYAQDLNGNRDSVVWEAGTDKVLRVRDPVGKTITFSYTAWGTFTHFTSLAGLPGARDTRVRIDSLTNQLTYDSIPSPAGAPYTTTYRYHAFDTLGTVVLTQRVGVIADTTRVTYDSTLRRRPVEVALPLVQDSSGAWRTPRIGYVAREYQGLAGLRALDSAYVQLTDPRGFWTRSLLDRWGQATRTWDALGVLGRASYLSDGRVSWSEGPVPDSSRVWTRYDTLRQPVKRFWVRAAGDTLRLDSLVYDAAYRVIRSVSPLDSVTTVTYDSLGNVIQQVGPTGTTTTLTYFANGQVNTTTTTGLGPVARHYDAAWKNDSATVGPVSQLLARTQVDAYGRDTLTLGPMRVEVTGSTSQIQWRKVRTWYTIANEVDSTVLYRGNNCNAPCSTPSFPATFDTLHRQAVGWRRDRAGRDTARVDTRGFATTYRLDRLGRVQARRPWADSASVRDSLVYDLAGNVILTVTRRGYVLTTNFDSRNRDTLAVIPTVGTVRTQYGGPAGQVTRQWVVGAVDSIGGVNGEVRWAWDQRGRLVADTAYTGSLPRAQGYGYDALDRPTTRTDATGTWEVRYESARGVPDTLLTPFGDTLRLVLDGLARPQSQWLSGPAGAPLQVTTRSWNESGAPTAGTHEVGVFNQPWMALDVVRPDAVDSVGPSLAPRGAMRDGPAAVPDTIQDSVSYDGWQRVVGWRQQRSAGGGSVVLRTYGFDAMGNLLQSGSELYDGMTNQLRKGPGGFLSYDNAGNLTTKLGTGYTFGYDALERLIWVRQNGVLIARYGYDVVGRRIVKRVYNGSTGGAVGYLRMVYAGSQVSFETDSANTSLSTIYTWGPGVDNLVAVRVADTSYAAVTDGLGSVRAFIRQADGAWVGRLSYDPYGQLLDSAGTLPAGRYRWTGREFDAETGLYFHRSRYYDPQAGRFVQEDLLGYAGGRNLYSYVDGQVLTARDPGGLILDLPTPPEGCEWWAEVRRRYSDDWIVWVGVPYLRCTGGGARGKIANFEKLYLPRQEERPSLAKELCRDVVSQRSSELRYLYYLADRDRVEYGQVFDVTGGRGMWGFAPRTGPLPGNPGNWPPGDETYMGAVFFAHAHVDWRPRERWVQAMNSYQQPAPFFSPADIDLAHGDYYNGSHVGQVTMGIALVRMGDVLVEGSDKSGARCSLN